MDGKKPEKQLSAVCVTKRLGVRQERKPATWNLGNEGDEGVMLG
jgi:hypothetical protein